MRRQREHFAERTRATYAALAALIEEGTPRMKRLCGDPLGEGDVEPEFGELSGQVSGEAGSLGALEVIGPKIIILRPALQHVIDRRQHGGRHRLDGLAWAPARFEPLKQGMQVGG